MPTKKKNQENDIVIRAIPPQDMTEAQRLKVSQVMVEMLRNRGFMCELLLPEDEQEQS
jgi:uncharacterized protein YgfB (UPF0149 family)